MEADRIGTAAIVFGLLLIVLGSVTSVTQLQLQMTGPLALQIPPNGIDPALQAEVTKGTTDLYVSIQFSNDAARTSALPSLTQMGFKPGYAVRTIPFQYGHLPSASLGQAVKISGVVAVWAAATNIYGSTEAVPTPATGLGFTSDGDVITMYDVAQYVGAVQAHQRGYTGAGIKIAMLDTGIAPEWVSKLFGDRIIASTPASMLPNGGVGCLGQEGGEDDYGHGTATTAMAAGAEIQTPYHTIGIAPGALIINAKMSTYACTLFGSGPLPGTEESLVQIAEWAVVDEGADVISASIGWPQHLASAAGFGTGAVVALINQFDTQYGVPWVEAAGNEPEVGDPYIIYPASSPTTIAVGTVSVKYHGGGWIAGVGQAQECSFFGLNGCWEPLPHPFISQDGKRKGIDIVAPGGMWLGTWPPYNSGTQQVGAVYEYVALPTLTNGAYDTRDTISNDGWAVGAGTSISTPVVAGAAALIQQYLGGRKPGNVEKIKSMLFSNTQDILDPGYDARSGYGVLNINKALPNLPTGIPPEIATYAPNVLEIVAGVILIFAGVFIRRSQDD